MGKTEWQRKAEEQKEIDREKARQLAEENRIRKQEKMRLLMEEAKRADAERLKKTENENVNPVVEVLISRTGNHFLTMLQDTVTLFPTAFILKRAGNLDRIAYPVLNGQPFESLEKAVRVYRQRLNEAGQLPADIATSTKEVPIQYQQF